MTEHACRWAGNDYQPRLLRTHLADCETDGCRGCEPCPGEHCTAGTPVRDGGCGGRAHTSQHQHVCVDCLHAARLDLGEIVRLHERLPEEVEYRGINSEAAHLAGPIASPDQWDARAKYAAAGQITLADCDARDLDGLWAWITAADHDTHPLWTVARLARIVRDALGHDEPDNLATVDGEAAYLEEQLTTLTHDPHFDFRDLATDLRRCRTHLEAVLHDGEQVDRGAPCMACGALLERTWGGTGKPDGWKCPQCQRTSTEDQYRFAVAQAALAGADVLTASQIAEQYGVPQATLRKWVQRGHLTAQRRRDPSGRQLFVVAEVKTLRDGEPMAS